MAKGQFPSSIVKLIKARDGNRCIYCGEPAQQIDHVVSRLRGGQAIKANGVCICRSCNCYKREHPNDMTFQTRGLFWLLIQGENVELPLE